MLKPKNLLKKKDSIKIYKAIEWDLQEDFSEGLKHIKDDYKKTKSKLKEESRKNLEETFKEVIEGIRLDVERLYPYYYQQFLSVIDIFSECLIFVDEYSQVYNSLKAFEQETQEIFSDLLEKGFVLPKMAECLFYHERSFRKAFEVDNSSNICLSYKGA